MDKWTETCGCGKPLHYSDPQIEAMVRNVVSRLGDTIWIAFVRRSVVYAVPRHYIALHGITSSNVPALAAQYGWGSRII